MKYTFGAICVLLLAFSAVPAQDLITNNDRAQIEQAIENWNKAWITKDHRLAALNYSEDADWTNAFGMSRKGRTEIEKTLKEVFSLPFVMEGKSKTVGQTIKPLSPSFVAVFTRVEREGQKLSSGETLATRRTSHLRIFAKTETWQIVSHLISDARETQRTTH